jgi:hypothetical protein
MAGLRWNTYALGTTSQCIAGPSDTVSSALTGISNMLMSLAVGAFAMTFALTRLAFSAGDWLGVFDDLLRSATSTFYDHVTLVWMPLTLIAVGLYLLWRSRRMDYSDTVRTAGWALLVVTIAVFVMQWPVITGRTFDNTVTGATGAVNAAMAGDTSRDGDPATAVAGNAHQAVLYNAWLRGTLGADSGRTSEKYGPDLFRASAYTWREAARCETDQDWCDNLTEEKQDLWKTTAAEVEKTDPDAYEFLQGKRSDERIAAALLADAGAMAVVPFLAIAAVLVIVALLMTRIGVLIFPVLAVFGAHIKARAVVERVWSAIFGAVMNAILFGFGAATLSLATGVLLAPGADLPVWLALILIGVLTVLLWHFTKPFRSFAAMSPLAGPVDRSHGLLKSTLSKAVGYGLTRHAIDAELDEHGVKAEEPVVAAAAPAEATYSAPPPEPHGTAPQAVPVALPAVAPGALPPAAAERPLADSAARSTALPSGAVARVPLDEMDAPGAAPQEADGWPGDQGTSAPEVAGPPAEPERVTPTVDAIYSRDEVEATPFETMPDIVEPEIDANGQEVYVLYRRGDEDA